MTFQGYLIIILFVLVLVLYVLYQRAARKKASVEYELKRAEYERDYQALKKEADETGDYFDKTLEEYIAIRDALDPIFAKYGSNYRFSALRPKRSNRGSEEV